MGLFGLFGPPDVGKMRAKKNVKGLIRVLEKQDDLELRKEAARALGHLGDPRAVGALISVLLHEVPVHQGFSDPTGWAEKRDRNNQLRCEAASALGEIGDEGAVKALNLVLKDDSLGTGGVLFGMAGARLRQLAARALRQIEAKKAKEAAAARQAADRGKTDEKKGGATPALPAGLPGPVPEHEFVSSNLGGDPGPGGSEFRTALLHWNDQSYDEAVEHYLKAIDLGLRSDYEAAARSNLGKIFLMRDDVEGAVDQFLKGLFLTPVTASTAYGCATYLAIIYEELGMTADVAATVPVAEAALKHIDSIMSASAADEVRETVKRVYGAA